jgi:hypothetical protein
MTGGAHLSASFNLSPTLPARARQAAPARAPDGTAARPDGPDAEPLCACARQGISRGGKTPLPFEATPTGTSLAIDARPRRLTARSSNRQAQWPLCPCVALTGCLHPEAEPLLVTYVLLWGFFHFPLFRCRERKERRRSGKKGGEKVGRAASAPRRENWRPSVDRSLSCQDRSCHAEEERHPGSRSRS